MHGGEYYLSVAIPPHRLLCYLKLYTQVCTARKYLLGTFLGAILCATLMAMIQSNNVLKRIVQGLFVPFARVGSGDPVRVSRLLHNEYTGCS